MYIWIQILVSMLILLGQNSFLLARQTQNQNNQVLLFTRTNNDQQEIWIFDFQENAATYTGLSIPSNSKAFLSPDGRFLAYFISTGINPIEIHIVERTQDTPVEILNIQEQRFINVMDFHWVDDVSLGFISNRFDQEYTIINVDGSYEIYSADIDVDISSDNWMIEYSYNFSYAAYIDFSGEFIVFWDLLEKQLIDTDVEIPISWITPSRDFGWTPSTNDFWIMNNELNWLVFSVPNDRLLQITSVGEYYNLQEPSIFQPTGVVAFQIGGIEIGHYDIVSVGVWMQGELTQTGFQNGSGQFRADWATWDKNGRFFAFTLLDFVNSETRINLFDINSGLVSTIYQEDNADEKVKVLGWISVE